MITPGRLSSVCGLAALALFTLAAAPATPDTLVNCGRQSLNLTLASLDKRVPTTVLVLGTCTELVQVKGHDGLTLRGLPGATLQQPALPPGVLLPAVLEVLSSRSVSIESLRIRAVEAFGLSIGLGSSDVRLRALAVEGGAYGVSVHGASQVSMARVTGRDPGWAAVGIWDMSAVHMEDCSFERSSSEGYSAGIQVGKAALVMHGTTIRDFQEGLIVEPGGTIEVHDISRDNPPGGRSEVLVDNPAGSNFVGLRIRAGSVVLATRLRITGAGQWWGGETGGVLVEDGGSLHAADHLEVSGSQGQGLLATKGARVSLGGSRITGSLHGGLVVVNQSSLAVAGNTPAEVSGNTTDLFCDSRSLITGGAGIGGATTVQCANLLAGPSEPLP
jgi:hypothetical protein